MISETSICNLALGRLGAYTITSLSQNSKEARACNSMYDTLRKIVLEAHNWTFAKRRATLSIASGVEVTGWVYVYYLPVDCLAARKIIDETLQQTGTYYDSEINTYVRSYEVEYEIITQGGTQYLVTNKEGAELEYTANIDDPTLFSNKFVDALAWRLCADLVQPLKGKVSLQVQAMNLYLQLLRDAEYKNAQQEYKRPSDANSFVGAR